MVDFPDTSFLCALYRRQDNTGRAVACRARMADVLQVTSLLEFEFLQSARWQVWLHAADRTKGYSQAEADKLLANWEADRSTGLVRLVPYDAEAMHHFAKSLSLRHTTAGGHRTLDLLHVATAVHLGAKNFLTFDARQKMLAKAVGLKTPL